MSDKYKLYSPTQRMLIAVGFIYLIWLLIVGTCLAIVSIFGFLGIWDVSFIGTASHSEAKNLADILIFFIGFIFNLTFAFMSVYISAHPQQSNILRGIGLVCLVMSIGEVCLDLALNQFTGVMSDVYKLLIVGLLFWLSCRLLHEYDEHICVDRNNLPRTVTGKFIYTEKKLKQARDEGILAERLQKVR